MSFTNAHRRKSSPMASPTAEAWQQHVVTADDLAGVAQDKPQQWVQVAARIFHELGTVSKSKRARKAGNLVLNGQPRVPTLTCAAVNDVLAYYSPEQQQQLTAGAARVKDSGAQKWLKTCKTQGLRVVYECNTLAVVVKPVGIHVKGRGKRTVEHALPLLLQRHQAVEASDFELPIPHAVHRLDYRVGGLLLVAKTRKMEVALLAQLEGHSVTKRYRAILVGDVRVKSPTSCGNISVVELPEALLKVRHELQFLDGSIDGKPCLTAMKIVSTTRSARYGWISTVDLWPITGRKHQLRIHTARYGHPIVGDDLYHGTGNPGKDREEVTFEHTGGEQDQSAVVRGVGLFLFSVGVAFDDVVGNRRTFRIEEPNKFARFRHFCELNWTKLAARRDRENDAQNV